MRRPISAVIGLSMLGASAPAALAAPAPVDPLINEFVTNYSGGDEHAFVEILGSPGADLRGFQLLEVGGWSGANPGEVVAATTIGTTDDAGYWIWNHDGSDYTASFLLVEAAAPIAAGTDLDADDDGSLDAQVPYTRLVDSIATRHSERDRTYGPVTLTEWYDGLKYQPDGASRVPNGEDTDSTRDWVRNDFDGAGFPGKRDYGIVWREAYNTPGAANRLPAVTEATIPQIQGDGAASPFTYDIVETSGVVTLEVYKGLYLQDVTGDGDASTSDAIYVGLDTAYLSGISEGDVVTVTGTVVESYGSTEVRNAEVTETGTTDVPTPVRIDEDLAADQGPDQAYYESLEHMRVELTEGYAYVGSNKYAESFLVPGDDDDERVRRTDERYDLFAIGNAEEYPNGLPTYAGDVVRNVVGPLDYTYDNYKLMVEDADAASVDRDDDPTPTPIELEDDGGLLTFGTWNLENVFPVQGKDSGLGLDKTTQEDVDAKRTKLGLAISEWLHAPDVLAVQEVANLELLQDLGDEVNALTGTTDYVAVLEEGNDPRKIDVGFLIDRNEVDGYANVRQIDKDAAGTVCRAGANDDLKHDRVPLAVDVTDNGRTITFVSVHLKSKFGGSAWNDYWEDCRVEQAQSVVDAVGDVRDLVVLGDVNAFRDSETLDVFESAGLTNVVNEIPEERRHSYAFSGRVQFLDHVLVSPSLLSTVELVDSPKIVTDVPVQILSKDTTTGLGSSDHDPILVQLEIEAPRPERRGRGGRPQD